jgi:hypothetical protein
VALTAATTTRASAEQATEGHGPKLRFVALGSHSIPEFVEMNTPDGGDALGLEVEAVANNVTPSADDATADQVSVGEFVANIQDVPELVET